MDTCNATLTVLLEADFENPENSVFYRHACGVEGMHSVHRSDREDGLVWEDCTHGAAPHRDPEPTYRVERHLQDAGWIVKDDRGLWDVAFFGNGHPAPMEAAWDEAARLNGEDTPDDLFVANLVDQRHEAAADRDRYRVALSKIAHRSFGPDLSTYRDYALRVLDGAQP